MERFKDIKGWCIKDNRIKALLLVGSYARNKQREDSDIDLVVITNDKDGILQHEWISVYGEVIKSQIEEYGKCTSIRVWYKDGTEIEYGIVDESWLSTPLDPGTRRVLEDGYRLLYGDNGIDMISINTALAE